MTKKLVGAERLLYRAQLSLSLFTICLCWMGNPSLTTRCFVSSYLGSSCLSIQARSFLACVSVSGPRGATLIDSNPSHPINAARERYHFTALGLAGCKTATRRDDAAKLILCTPETNRCFLSPCVCLLGRLRPSASAAGRKSSSPPPLHKDQVWQESLLCAHLL